MRIIIYVRERYYSSYYSSDARIHFRSRHSKSKFNVKARKEDSNALSADNFQALTSPCRLRHSVKTSSHRLAPLDWANRREGTASKGRQWMVELRCIATLHSVAETIQAQLPLDGKSAMKLRITWQVTRMKNQKLHKELKEIVTKNSF